MNWLYYICVGLVSFGVIAILGIITSGLIYKLVFSFYSSLVMFVIFILGLKQSDITSSTNEVKSGEPLVYTITDKYMSSEKDLMDRIDHLIEMKELFLNPGLTVQNVANSLRVNRTYISNIINRQKGVNFYQYINTYRINYAIELMRNNNAEKSLASIAEESGFKSKSTFYTFFKIVKKCTPGEYQNLYLNEDEDMTDI